MIWKNGLYFCIMVMTPRQIGNIIHILLHLEDRFILASSISKFFFFTMQNARVRNIHATFQVVLTSSFYFKWFQSKTLNSILQYMQGEKSSPCMYCKIDLTNIPFIKIWIEKQNLIYQVYSNCFYFKHFIVRTLGHHKYNFIMSQSSNCTTFTYELRQ